MSSLPLQRRVIRTLVGAQILTSLGMASGMAVGVLLAEELSGSETLAGFGTTAQVLGGALIAIPTARIMAARGRRPGLQFAYSLAALGAIVILVSALLGNYWVLLLGMLAFGGATAGNGQSRYAAADLADDAHRGRDLSIVVWAATIGAVLGPNLIGPGRGLGRLIGIPDLAGSFIFALVGLVLGIAVLSWWLRPDPLLVSRDLARAQPEAAEVDHDGSLRRGLRILRTNVDARRGALVTALGHVVMVGVMGMTPLHMAHGHAELEVIGFVLSIHILGMFAFSPLVGMGVDRWGGRIVAAVGGVLLTAAALLTSVSQAGWSGLLLAALFLLGLGWSCTLVSGSTMLTSAVRPDERPAVQGLTEVMMGLAAAAGGALAGFVMERLGYGALGLGAAAVALAVVWLAAVRKPGSPGSSGSQSGAGPATARR